MMKSYLIILILFTPFLSLAQTPQTLSADSLSTAIVKLQLDVEHVKLNLGKVEKRFKSGIVVSTIGYSTVIIGGLMLGRKNDELGKGLLITGGVCGVTGTILMVDAFKFL